MRFAVLIALLLSLATACGKHPPASNADAGTDDVSAEPLDENECGVSAGGPSTAVIRELLLVAQKDGVTTGLDLDGRVSDLQDAEGCFKGDLVDEEGNPGIDNQFSLLVPALLNLAGEGLTSAIQRTINEGGLLLMLGVDRVDDLDADACVEVELFRAAGRPAAGGLGLIEPGQTFDRDSEKPAYFVPEATLEDGWISAGPVSLEMPMQVAQYDLFLTIEDATVVFTMESDGSMRGFIAGALLMDEISSILDEIDEGAELIAGFRTIMLDNADLAPDENGDCQRMSISIEFEATQAFVFAEEP